MSLKPTKPMSGMIELLPIQQRCFDECSIRMQKVLKTAGFSKLDLPSLERAEVLTDEDNWDEIQTQMYLFQKGETKMGLRYDGTVGLARYVSKNISTLDFPFRAYQFAKNFRGERPQRGRYREFYQMDLDVLGINVLSVNYDAEIVATLANTYKSVEEFVGPVNIKIGNRKFWNAIFEYLNLSAQESRDLFILIDKKDKLKDFKEILEKEAGKKAADLINKVFENGYKSFIGITPGIDIAILELDTFMEVLIAMGINNAKIDMGIMRGHAYYTGIVFEFFLDNFPELGSVGGGGRYEDLTSKFSKTKIIGVGAAVGFSRMMVALMEDDRIDLSSFKSSIFAAVLIMGQEFVPYSMSILSKLRSAGIVSIAYLDVDKKFKNQIEYADKINANYSIIIGEDEVKTGKLAVKNMETGIQESLSIADIIKNFKG